MTHHVLFGFKVFLAIFVSIALTLAFFYIGFVAGYSNGVSDGVVSGWLSAKEAVDTTGLFPVIAPEQQNAIAITATVESVSEGGFMVNADNLNPNPLDMSTPAKRNVAITADTKLVKRVEKSAAEQQKDFEAFQQALSNITAESGFPVPPITYTETPASLNDFKAGDRIAIEAAENIWSAASFTASKISLISSAPTE